MGFVCAALEKLNYVCTFGRLRGYKANVSISAKVGNYTVKTAETPEEIYKALRLRYQIFYKKYWGRTLPLALDRTSYDKGADQLIVLDSKGAVVGTYRLRCSKFVDEFYASSEFDLGDFFDRYDNSDEVLLELGRACIEPKARQGMVLTALWRGIALYCKTVGASKLFGCVSVHTQDAEVAAKIYKWLEKQDALSKDYYIEPWRKYRVEGFADWLKVLHFDNVFLPAEPATLAVEEYLPPLFQSYLNMGAKVCTVAPAKDTHFKVMDYFTILDLKKLEPRYARKFEVA